jgi:hypothetical protein
MVLYQKRLETAEQLGQWIGSSLTLFAAIPNDFCSQIFHTTGKIVYFVLRFFQAKAAVLLEWVCWF